MFFMSTVRFLLHLDVVQPFSKSFRLPLLTLIISTIETLFIPILVQLSMVSIKVGFVILTKLILFSFIEIRPLHPVSISVSTFFIRKSRPVPVGIVRSVFGFVSFEQLVSKVIFLFTRPYFVVGSRFTGRTREKVVVRHQEIFFVVRQQEIVFVVRQQEIVFVWQQKIIFVIRQQEI